MPLKGRADMHGAAAKPELQSGSHSANREAAS
jgi:hypothetical protein